MLEQGGIPGVCHRPGRIFQDHRRVQQISGVNLIFPETLTVLIIAEDDTIRLAQL